MYTTSPIQEVGSSRARSSGPIADKTAAKLWRRKVPNISNDPLFTQGQARVFPYHSVSVARLLSHIET